MLLLDTNVILRYLRDDDTKLSPLAKLVFEDAKKGKNKLYFDEVAIAETIWVLISTYETDKTEVVTKLTKLIAADWIYCPQKELVLKSLNAFLETNVSYVDCWLYCLSKAKKLPFKTFDKKLASLKT